MTQPTDPRAPGDVLEDLDLADLAVAAPGGQRPATLAVVGHSPLDGRLAHEATGRTGTANLSRQAAEERLVTFVTELLQAPAGTAGRVVTGVETAALAVLRAARDARPHLEHATVVLPASVHPAYFTAADVLGMTPVVVPVDDDGRARLGPMTSAIRDDTVLLVASAPSYTHGTIDPIGWLAGAAAVREVPFHVDATCGGWAMAYAERVGRLRPGWGFAVAGVASLAIDLGPETGGPADLVAVLHRDPAAAHVPSVAGVVGGPLDLPARWSRPNPLVAAAVETLDELGHDGCARLAVDALDATGALIDGLLDQRGVQLAARPDATVVTLRADLSCDVVTVADELDARGWTTYPVLPDSGAPMLRLPVTAATIGLVDHLLAAIREAVGEAQSRARAQVDPGL